jgi:hypothetical protein
MVTSANPIVVCFTLTFVVLLGSVGAAKTADIGEACGGTAKTACAPDRWCEPQPGQCGGADPTGTCVRVPEICNEAYIPVCGCDTKTYGNDCERRAAKVRKAHDGTCS